MFNHLKKKNRDMTYRALYITTKEIVSRQIDFAKRGRMATDLSSFDIGNIDQMIGRRRSARFKIQANTEGVMRTFGSEKQFKP
ncbi:hypothetical protein NPIL_587681 [Nephila pilipes]|uniref:Uncharacterized protein n=1 Tax=Nephila pilipes TaxID=299642 RepID=A0A8X6JR46_NEPPI|nr:hypothetical protein NPIL_587681 [Nephila pilipes]